MVQTLLNTKLHIPAPRSPMVVRAGLLDLLTQGLRTRKKLFLLSAPAGFGKTTLVSAWIQETCLSLPGEKPCRVAWVSLDEKDNDPLQFLHYMIAAFQKADPWLGLTSLELMQMPPLGAETGAWREKALMALINDLSEADGRYVLVLDDYHTITERAVDQMLAYFLDHLPEGVRVVLTTRVDPALPLPRLRARNQLLELRAADLRFDEAEAAAFLKDVMGLDLSPAQITLLEERTEGWIAGLQLAALSMQGHQDFGAFIQAFSGSNRFVLDYLIEEVLNRQSPERQDFLIKTSILGQMNAEVCQALTGCQNSQPILEALDQENLFVVRLDEERCWYRYHHLFAEFLRSRFRQTYKEQAAAYHLIASQWFEKQTMLPEAIEQALNAQELGRAADLLEHTPRTMLTPVDAGIYANWLGLLPEDLIQARAGVCLLQAWVLLSHGEVSQVGAYLERAGDLIRQGQGSGLGEVYTLQSLAAALLANYQAAIELAGQALECLGPDELALRALVALDQTLAYEMLGELEAAGQACQKAYEASLKSGNLVTGLTALCQLADIKQQQGDLAQALELNQRAIDITHQNRRQQPLAGIAYLRIGMLQYELNHLEQAEDTLKTALSSGQQWESSDISANSLIGLAMVEMAKGQFGPTRAYLRQAEEMLNRQVISSVSHEVINANITRLSLALGDEALMPAWLQVYQEKEPVKENYLRMMVESSLARVYLTQGKYTEAGLILDQLAQCFENKGLVSFLVEVCLLRALVYQAAGQLQAAGVWGRRAVELAAGKGFTRKFVDEGVQAQQLLKKIKREGAVGDYIGYLLGQFEGKSGLGKLMLGEKARQEGLVEVLSEREIQVLRLIADGQNNQAIARELVVAVSTVKTHINNLYGKLGVTSRIQAVSVARQKHLI
jgi:LuxR family maltose regulon positive regulatory protein